MNDLETIAKKLHKLNFGDNGIMQMNWHGKSDYRYSEEVLEKENDDNKILNHAKDGCLACCDVCKKKYGLHPSSITHGTHTLDFLDAHAIGHDQIETWSKKPVLFVMENPASVNANFYAAKDSLPATPKRWYWIMGQSERKNEDFIYPNYFSNREYGWMIYSVIRTFKMANAYVTNMVKCGIEQSGYVTTEKYDPRAVSECINRHLVKETDTLCNDEQDVVVFAFGDRVYNKLFRAKNCFNKKLHLYKLPHPARQMPNDHRKFVLFGQIYSALLENDFYEQNEKPDIDDLLRVNIADSEPDLAEIVGIWANERKIINRELEYSKSKSYKPQRLSYEITPNDEFYTTIVFRIIEKLSFNNNDYNVCWLEYSIENNSLSLYAGKNKTANVAVPEEYAKTTFVYAEMQSLLNFPQFKKYFEPIIGCDFAQNTIYKL